MTARTLVTASRHPFERRFHSTNLWNCGMDPAQTNPCKNSSIAVTPKTYANSSRNHAAAAFLRNPANRPVAAFIPAGLFSRKSLPRLK